MKRIGRLWERIVSFENLYAASRKARRGKRGIPSVQRFEHDLERNLVRLQEELRTQTYRPGPFRQFQIYDSKPRTISAAPYRDRVVHHALCNVLEPIFERSFIFDSYASRPGKGTHAALDRFTCMSRRWPYVLKADVEKFFPSIDHAILKERLARKIEDRDVLWLAGAVVDHAEPPEWTPPPFPGDDLFTAVERRRGLPIGNQTSQFFGNVYLDALDHFVKERLRRRGYIRYVDDFVVFGNSTMELAGVRNDVEKFLQSLRLHLHPGKRAISRTADGTRFLGFRVWPHHRRLPAETYYRVRRKLRWQEQEFSAGRLSRRQVAQSVSGWKGHARHANTHRLQRTLLSGIRRLGATV